MSEEHRDKVERHIAQAIEDGARLVTGALRHGTVWINDPPGADALVRRTRRWRRVIMATAAYNVIGRRWFSRDHQG